MTVATPGPLPPPPPRRGGCLSGCLIALGILVVIVIAIGGGLYWYLASGAKDNETLKAAIVEVNNDMTAREVLGDHIAVEGALTSFGISTDTKNGKVENFAATVKGSKAQGVLTVEALTPPGGPRHFNKLELTGPDGKKYEIGGTGGDTSGNGGI